MITLIIIAEILTIAFIRGVHFNNKELCYNQAHNKAHSSNNGNS